MANGLDPRVLQQQGRAFQIAASTILQKRQNEAQIEEMAKRTILGSLIKLSENPNFPLDSLAGLTNELNRQFGIVAPGEQVTGEDFGDRAQVQLAQETGQKLALGTQGTGNVEDLRFAIEAMKRGEFGELPSEQDEEVTARIGALGGQEAASRASADLRREKRITEVAFTRDEIVARIAKLERETEKIGKTGGPSITEILRTMRDLGQNARIILFGDPRTGVTPGTKKEQEAAQGTIDRIDRVLLRVGNQALEQKDLEGLKELVDFMSLARGQARSRAISQRTPEEIRRRSSQQPGLPTGGTQEVATVSPQRAGGTQQQGAPARPITALKKQLSEKRITKAVFLQRLGSLPNLNEDQIIELGEAGFVSIKEAQDLLNVVSQPARQVLQQQLTRQPAQTQPVISDFLRQQRLLERVNQPQR